MPLCVEMPDAYSYWRVMHTQGTGEDYYLDASSDFWDTRFFFRSRRTGRWISGIYPSGRFKTSAKMADSMLFTRS